MALASFSKKEIWEVMVPEGIKQISLCSFVFSLIISDCSHKHKMVYLCLVSFLS